MLLADGTEVEAVGGVVCGGAGVGKVEQSEKSKIGTPC